jgi:hypothetical protein
LEAAISWLVIATLRNAAAAAEQTRRQAHDLVDRYFDLVLGVCTNLSERVLDTLEETLAQHERHLARLLVG